MASKRAAVWTAGALLLGGAAAFAQPAPSPPTPAAPAQAAPIDEPGGEAVVRTNPTRNRSATEFVIPVAPFREVPRASATELLSLAPGVMLSNEGTEGHAQHVFLRGFTGDNGQDLALSLEGVPLNEEGNIHGQGYVDLYFIIPELVTRLDVTEGVSDPRQGNFAVAGSIDYRLALPHRGVMLRGAYGMYGYRRLLALWGPQRGRDSTFVGVDLVHSDGFGPSRGFDRASAMAQHRIELGADASLTLLTAFYAGRWTAPGVVREDDYEAGRSGFFDSLGELGRQGGFSSRALLAATLSYRRPKERTEARFFGQLRDFGLTENFTGFVLRPRDGDLIEQRFQVGMLGAAGHYHRDVSLFNRDHEFELGWFLRHDRGEPFQRRLIASSGEPSPQRDAGDVDAQVRATQLGLYGDVVARITRWLTVRGGARVDVLGYNVEASVYNTTEQRGERVFRTAVGTSVVPKATVELGPWRGFTVLASHGGGFRSPDPLTVADGETAPFVRLMSQELGVRFNRLFTRGRRVSMSLAGYHTLVDRDFLFDPTQGRSVAIGSTRRLGAVYWARVQPGAGFDVNASVTFTHATVLSDALGNTVPAGSLLPYVPRWVGRLDAGWEREVARWRNRPLRVRAGLGAQFYGERPLPLDDRSEPVFVVDASAGVRLGAVELGVSGRNILDARWRDAQLNFASNYNPGTVPSLFPVRHFNAGTPLTIIGNVTLYL